MDTDFCDSWQGLGVLPENKYCRICNSELCNRLWKIVKQLASKDSHKGTCANTKTGKSFRLFTTQRQSKNICKFQSLSADRRGVCWNISKEDFLYVLKTGKDNTPSKTRQKSHVEPIVDLIRRSNNGRELIDLIKEL